jgi:hypothetical protein
VIYSATSSYEDRMFWYEFGFVNPSLCLNCIACIFLGSLDEIEPGADSWFILPTEENSSCSYSNIFLEFY